MNVNAFHHFYDYHFAINRALWACITQLSAENFTQPANYSHGSVQTQLLHLIHVDDIWFSDLGGTAFPEPLEPAGFSEYAVIRRYWDEVEQKMRDYLATLTDEMLATKPLSGEDKDLTVWQVLLHVVNHGTDHRAQLLRMLNGFGVDTPPQDYIFFVYDNLV